jgi:purine nucleosidase
LTAAYALGETGIPTAGKSLPEGASLPESDAFDALSEWIGKTVSPRRVLALGPLTNIAALVLARPELAGRIDELVWMGGAIGRGNHTASAEFNAAADPEAAAIVLAHHIPVKMVDLDFCRKIEATPADVLPVRAAGGRNAELLADLLEGFIDIAISRGRPAMALYDPAAAFAFAEPAAVGFQPAGIAIELQGALTRGRTVVETRRSHATFNACYAVEVDAERARATILDALVKEARRA